MRKLWGCLFLGTYLFLPACFPIPPLYCTDQTPCGTKTGAICVLSEGMPGACALPDDNCPSKYRYYKDSGFGRDNQCAALPRFELQINSTSVAEYDVFSVHAIIKDGDDRKLTTYKGVPEVSAEWGDAKVSSFSGFVNGEADYLLWLNRQTDASNELEHVILKDGKSLGRSDGISVTAGQWHMKVEGSIIKFDPSVTAPIALVFSKSAPVYDVFYADSMKPTKIFRATSANPLAGRKFIPPDWENKGVVLSTDDIPWKPDNIAPTTVVKIHNHFVMSYISYFINSRGGLGTKTGLARSDNTVSWQNISNGPLASVPTPGDSECTNIDYGSLVVDGEKLRIIYKAYIPSSSQYFTDGFLCTAESTDDGSTWANAKVMKNFITYNTNVTKDGNVYRETRGLTSRDAVTWSGTVPSDPDFVFPVFDEELRRYAGFKYADDMSHIDIFTR